MSKITASFSFLIKWTFRLLVSFIPRDRNTYVFGAWYGEKFSDNSKYIYLKALSTEGIAAIWITKDKSVLNYMQGKGLPAFHVNSLKGIYYQLRAAAYFTSVSRQDVSQSLLSGAVRINLWHGLPLKKIMYDDHLFFDKRKAAESSRLQQIKAKIRRNMGARIYGGKDYVVSSSKTITDIYKRAFKKDGKYVLQMGQPRNDVFFRDDLETDEFPLKAGNKKLILYMPTHRNGGKVQMDMNRLLDLEGLNRMCEKHNCVFLIKKHFYHQDDAPVSGFGNIKDITNDIYDSQVLLKYADILITDYSSCYIDYLLLDRPLIFYNYDQDEYVKVDRELYFDYEEVTPGVKVQTADKLLNAIDSYLSMQQPAPDNRHIDTKNLFYSPDNQHEVGDKILAKVSSILAN